mgnify:FL=1
MKETIKELEERIKFLKDWKDHLKEKAKQARDTDDDDGYFEAMDKIDSINLEISNKEAFKSAYEKDLANKEKIKANDLAMFEKKSKELMTKVNGLRIKDKQLKTQRDGLIKRWKAQEYDSDEQKLNDLKLAQHIARVTTTK